VSNAIQSQNLREQQQVEQDIADLHALGYTQTLRRTIGSFTSFALGFAMTSITAAIFTAFSPPFDNVGGAAIWLWVPILLGVMAITMVYAHLSARLPLTGYAYQWSARLVNHHYGWFTGWAAVLAFTAGTAGLSIGMASVFAPYVWDNPTHHQLELFGIVMIIVGIIINAVGVRAATWINNIGASVELVGTIGLAVITLVGLFFFSHKAGPSILFHTNRIDGGHVDFTAVMLAALLPVYTLIGWEGSADLAEETRDPRRTAPKAMIRAVLITTLGGFFIFAVFSMAIPHGIKDTFGQSESPIIYIFNQQFGRGVGDLMKVIAFIAFLSALLATVAVCTRLIYSLARDRMLPGHQVLSVVNERTRTPLYVIALVGVISIVLNLMSSGIVSRIVSIVAVCYYGTYVLTMAGAIWAHRRGRMPSVPAGQGYMDLGRSLIAYAVVGIAFALFIMGYLTLPKVNHTAGTYTIYAYLVGVAWWVLWLGWQIRAGKAGPPDESLSIGETDDERAIAVESSVDPIERVRA
jgi:amino acid transporter